MTSKIREIYKAVADLKIGDIRSRDLPEIHLQVNDADLPLRLLLPVTSEEGTFVLVGNLEGLQWTIRDLCLWAPIGTGAGVSDLSDRMLEFIIQYILLLKSMRGVTTQSRIVSFGMRMGPTLWDETMYWSIDTTLQIEEFV